MSTVFIDKNSSTSIVSLSIDEQNNEALQSVSLRVSNTPQATSYASLAESQELVATELAQYNSFEIDSNTLASAELISLVGAASTGGVSPRLFTEVVELPSSFVKASDMDKRTRMWFEQQKDWCSVIKRVKGSDKSDVTDGFPTGAVDWPVTRQNMGNLLCVGDTLVPSIEDPTDSFYLSRSSKLRVSLPSQIERIGPIFNDDEPYIESTLGSYSYWTAPMYQGMMIPMQERLNPAYGDENGPWPSVKAHSGNFNHQHGQYSKYRILVPIQSVGIANITLLHTGTQKDTNGELRDYWKPYIVNNDLTGQNYISIRIEGEERWFDTTAEVDQFTTDVLKNDEGEVDVSYFSKENGGLVKRDKIRYKKYPWRYLKTPKMASTIDRHEPTITGRLPGQIIIAVRKDDLYLPEVGVSPWDTTTEEWRKAVKEEKKVQRMHVKLCNYSSGEKIDLGHVILNGRSQAPGNGANEDIEITGIIEDNPALSLRTAAESNPDSPTFPNHYFLTFAAQNLVPPSTLSSIGENRANWYFEVRFSEWTLGIEHALRTNERFMYSVNVDGQSRFRNTWSSEHPSRIHKGILGQTLETETLESIIEESLSTYAYCDHVIRDEDSVSMIQNMYQTSNYVSSIQTETLEWTNPQVDTGGETVQTEEYGWKSIYGKVITDNNNETQDYYSVQPFYSFQLSVPPDKLGNYHKITTVKIEVKCRFSFSSMLTAREFWPDEWNFLETNPFVNHPLFVDDQGDALYHLVGHFHEIPDSGVLEVRDFVGYSRAIDRLQKIYIEEYGSEFLPQTLEDTGNLRTNKSPDESRLTLAGYRQHFKNVSELSLMLERYLRARAYLTYRITWESPNGTNNTPHILKNVNFNSLELPPQAPEDLSFFIGAATADNFDLGSWKPSAIPAAAGGSFGEGITPTDKPIASVPTGYPFHRPHEWVEQIEAVQLYTPTMYSNYFIKF